MATSFPISIRACRHSSQAAQIPLRQPSPIVLVLTGDLSENQIDTSQITDSRQMMLKKCGGPFYHDF